MKRIALTLVLTLIFGFLFCGIPVQPVHAKVFWSIYIDADGSVVGTNRIRRDGDLYTLTCNFSDGIGVQKSNIVVDGAGYTLEGKSQGRGVDISGSNVTVKNMRIVNWERGINCGSGNTFIGNYLANCSFQIFGSNNTLRHNTILSGGVCILYSGINVITENNFIDFGLFVGVECPEQIVDKNYWSDYLTKYPNAKEIDNTGIWDTPYCYDWFYDGVGYTDDHPLIESVTVIEPDPAIPEFPSLIFILPIIAAISVGLLVHFKKRKR